MTPPDAHHAPARSDKTEDWDARHAQSRSIEQQADGSFKAVDKAPPARAREELQFTYKNWRDEVARRRVKPISIHYGRSAWHPEPQWFLFAEDLDKYERREFAMRDMTEVSPDALASLAPAPPSAPATADVLTFSYRNWRSQTDTRRARPISVRFGQSKWHPQRQWLLLADDLDRGEQREFAMCDMFDVSPEGLSLTAPASAPSHAQDGLVDQKSWYAGYDVGFRDGSQEPKKPASAAWRDGVEAAAIVVDGFSQRADNGHPTGTAMARVFAEVATTIRALTPPAASQDSGATTSIAEPFRSPRIGGPPLQRPIPETTDVRERVLVASSGGGAFWRYADGSHRCLTKEDVALLDNLLRTPDIAATGGVSAGALNCKEWHWDGDQHDACTFTRDEIRTLLSQAPTPNAKTEGV